ncbi:MAG: hypothetical protein ACI3VN_02045 [Candidatus Onthomonas sp.]
MAANQNDNQPHQSNVSLGLRALVLLYVLYLVYGIVAAYVQGSSDALSLPLTIAAAGILGTAAIVLLVLTYRQWRTQSDAEASAQKDALETDLSDSEDDL